MDVEHAIFESFALGVERKLEVDLIELLVKSFFTIAKFVNAEGFSRLFFGLVGMR